MKFEMQSKWFCCGWFYGDLCANGYAGNRD